MCQYFTKELDIKHALKDLSNQGSVTVSSNFSLKRKGEATSKSNCIMTNDIIWTRSRK